MLNKGNKKKWKRKKRKTICLNKKGFKIYLKIYVQDYTLLILFKYICEGIIFDERKNKQRSVLGSKIQSIENGPVDAWTVTFR